MRVAERVASVLTLLDRLEAEALTAQRERQALAHVVLRSLSLSAAADPLRAGLRRRLRDAGLAPHRRSSPTAHLSNGRRIEEATAWEATLPKKIRCRLRQSRLAGKLDAPSGDALPRLGPRRMQHSTSAPQLLTPLLSRERLRSARLRQTASSPQLSSRRSWEEQPSSSDRSTWASPPSAMRRSDGRQLSYLVAGHRAHSNAPRGFLLGSSVVVDTPVHTPTLALNRGASTRSTRPRSKGTFEQRNSGGDHSEACGAGSPDSAATPRAYASDWDAASLRRAARLFARRRFWYKCVAVVGGRYYSIEHGLALQYVLGKRMVCSQLEPLHVRRGEVEVPAGFLVYDCAARALVEAMSRPSGRLAASHIAVIRVHARHECAQAGASWPTADGTWVFGVVTPEGVALERQVSYGPCGTAPESSAHPRDPCWSLRCCGASVW